jgi:hypothetical protein
MPLNLLEHTLHKIGTKTTTPLSITPANRLQGSVNKLTPDRGGTHAS